MDLARKALVRDPKLQCRGLSCCDTSEGPVAPLYNSLLIHVGEQQKVGPYYSKERSRPFLALAF